MTHRKSINDFVDVDVTLAQPAPAVRFEDLVAEHRNAYALDDAHQDELWRRIVANAPSAERLKMREDVDRFVAEVSSDKASADRARARRVYLRHVEPTVRFVYRDRDPRPWGVAQIVVATCMLIAFIAGVWLGFIA